MTSAIEKTVPKYLTLTDEGVSVALRYPTEFGGVKVDTLFLRAPTVRDVRAASATSGGDAEKREMSLFSSLSQMGVKDLEGLKLIDYSRVQEGYFRLVEEDEL